MNGHLSKPPVAPKAPNLKEPLEPIPLEEAVRRALDGDGKIYGCCLNGGCVLPMEELSFENCWLKGVQLPEGILEQCSFLDTRISRCDLSGAKLAGSWMNRVWVEECRLSGVDLLECSLQDTMFADCKLENAQLSLARWKMVSFCRCKMTGTAFHEVRHQGLRLEENQLEASEWLHTPLAGVDLTSNQLEGIRVLPENLKGAIVTPVQASGLARLLGLVIHDPGGPAQ